MTTTHAKAPAPPVTAHPKAQATPAPEVDEHLRAAPAVDLSRVSIGASDATGHHALPPADGALLVDSTPATGQLAKAEFFAELRREIVSIAEVELAGTDWTVDDCPWLDYWFAYYETRSARDAEAALLRYAPGARDATDATGYLAPAVERVRVAIQRWRKTGEIDAPPAAMPETAELAASLGPGEALDASTRSRLENAMGTDLGDTRIHTDAIAASAASAQDASAFAIGSHVAFADGAYKPGTVAGDALLAHELAHTVQQRDARATSGIGDALEHDADRATVGVLARLLGLVSPWGVRPTMKSGLQLRRCPTKVQPQLVAYDENGPDRTFIRATPELPEVNAERRAVKGQTVTFHLASQSRSLDEQFRTTGPVVNWEARMLLDETGTSSGHRLPKQRLTDAGIPVSFDRAGLWLISMEVKIGSDHFILGTKIRVADPAVLAKTTATAQEFVRPDFRNFRLNLAEHARETFHVVKDQPSGLFIAGTTQQHSYIESSAPSNPMEHGSQTPVTFTIVPDPRAVRFKWWQQFGDPSKHPKNFVTGGSLEDLGTGRTQAITMDRADTYLITCEQFDATGQKLQTAQYRQSVLAGSEWSQAGQWIGFVKDVDKRVAEIEPSTLQSLPAVFVSKVTAEVLPMPLFVGQKKGDPTTYLVHDFMFSIGPHRADSDSMAKAIGNYLDWAEDHYPPGEMFLRGSLVGDKDRTRESDGMTPAQHVANFLGMTPVKLSALGFALMLFPPTEGLGWAVMAGASTLAAIQSVASIYSRVKGQDHDVLGYAIDIASLATSVLQGSAAFNTAYGVLKTGKAAEQLIVSAAGRKFVAWTETGLVGTTALLITAEALGELGRINDSTMTAGEKADRISALLFQIAMQGGMFALQAKSMDTVAAALKQRNASLTQIRVIAQIDEQAAQNLAKLPDVDVNRLAAAIVDNPPVASRALASGTVTSIEQLEKEVAAAPSIFKDQTPAPGATTTTPPTTMPDAPTTTPDAPKTPNVPTTPDVPKTPDTPEPPPKTNEPPPKANEPPPKANEPPSKATDPDVAVEVKKIEADVAKTRAPVEEASNWDEVRDLLGPPPKKLGAKPPEGYEVYEVNGRKFLRRKKGRQDLVQLTLDEGQNFALPTGSNRLAVQGRLAKNLGPRPANHQAHHLIPDETVRKHPLMKLAREKAGYDLDRASNGVYLPETKPARAANPGSNGLPLHQGSHPQYTLAANTRANRILDRLLEKYGTLDQIPMDEIRRAASQLEMDMSGVINGWTSKFGDKLK